MKLLCKIGVLFSALLLLCSESSSRLSSNNVDTREEKAAEYLESLEPIYSQKCNEQALSGWDFETNITKENEERSVVKTAEFSAFQASVQKEILEKFPDWPTFKNETIRREFYYLSIRGPATMDPKLVKEQTKIGAEMESAYGSAKVCKYRSKNKTSCEEFNLDPEITTVMKKSRNFDELAYYWDAWHDTMAQAVPLAKYKRFMELDNEYAKANNYSNMGEMWASVYDDGSPGFSLTTFRAQMDNLWKQIKPYYDVLHAYVKMRLQEQPEYAGKLKKYHPYLPGCIMGDMWAQEWTPLEAFTKPYKDIPSFDVTEAMNKAGYTPKIMFQKADEFFQSLGLPGMTQTFWEKSMIVRPPKGRDVVCHGSAQDFCLGKGNTDFRIKMCTKVDQEDFFIVHHEMGHIEYYMMYTNQPYIFRDGANSGFHEAVGDTIALSVSTPRHLQCKLGLQVGTPIACDKTNDSVAITPEDINYLYFLALDKLPLYPFALSMDTWRWGIFDGSISDSEYNKQWWDIRRKNQGIVSPNPRNETLGLDAAAKYHIVGDYEYMRYFVSYVLQFQFYEAMCIKAGEFRPNDPTSRPLHQCDFGGSKEAGKALGEMLALGLSKPWPKALKVLTGSEEMRVEPLLNYFRPLIQHLEKELEKRGVKPGFENEQ